VVLVTLKILILLQNETNAAAVKIVMSLCRPQTISFDNFRHILDNLF
jgi:hypothetical protein